MKYWVVSLICMIASVLFTIGSSMSDRETGRYLCQLSFCVVSSIVAIMVAILF